MKTCEDILSDLAMNKDLLDLLESFTFIVLFMKLHCFVLFGMNTKKDLLDQATNDLVMEDEEEENTRKKKGLRVERGCGAATS